MTSSNKGPSHGQKVDLGSNAPTTAEGPGAVASDSLAAESRAFQKANDVSAEQGSSKTQGSEAFGTPSEAHREAGSAQYSSTDTGTGNSKSRSGQADAAPTYVNNVLGSNAGTAGPHGKNIKQDDSIGSEDKAKNASFTEFDTDADPGRLAEKQFAANGLQPGAAVAQSASVRQQDVGDGSTRFDALGSSREA